MIIICLILTLIIKFFIGVYFIDDGDNEDEEGLERSCETLVMCIITTLNNGLRNGGGIGDVLRKPSSKVLKNLCILHNLFFIKRYICI
jgi:hypothetical protein